MTGGDPTGLRDVLCAKDTVALPPIDQAYDIVLRDMRTKQKTDPSVDERAAIEKAFGSTGPGQDPYQGFQSATGPLSGSPGIVRQVDRRWRTKNDPIPWVPLSEPRHQTPTT